MTEGIYIQNKDHKKINKLLLLLVFIIIFFAVINTYILNNNLIRSTGYTWFSVGHVEVSVYFGSHNNTDRAIGVFEKGPSKIHGIGYKFQGKMQEGKNYHIETNISYMKSFSEVYSLQLYNSTDKTILHSVPLIVSKNDTINRNSVTASLNYTASALDDGDELQLRYVKIQSDLRKPIDPSVDQGIIINSASLNGLALQDFNQVFLPKPFVDIPSKVPSKKEVAEMDLVFRKTSDWLIGKIPPTEQELIKAIASYEQLAITVKAGQILGNIPEKDITYRSWEKASFLKVFAQYLKHNSNDSSEFSNGLTIQEMSIRTIWFFTDMFYRGKLPRDYNNYYFKLFAIPSSFLIPILNNEIYNKYYYSLYIHSNQLVGYWTSEKSGLKVANLDIIGNISIIPLIFGLQRNTQEERLQWMKGFRRYYERFMSYSVGAYDGIKPDGSSFHHFSALNNYTYNYNTPMKVLSILDGTSFQVSSGAYKRFRDAVYTQLFLANDNVEPLSMSGRHPHARGVALNKKNVIMLANAGKKILGLSEADPTLIKAYVRQWGSHPEHPKVMAENLSGFSQFNHHSAGAFWKNNYLVVARGETNWSAGSEIYRRSNNYQNLYGRYQSYGALEVIYPRGQEKGNGYKVDGWNWNFNPGTTSIVLPWHLLKSEYLVQRERQKKRFVGSLSFGNYKGSVLSKTYGKLGIFGMDFLEDPQTGSTQLSPVTHNSTFKFKKSIFFFESYIVALGSGISNNDEKHPTITTLYQRSSDLNNTVVVNSNSYSSFGETAFSSEVDNWLIDNFKTGYFIVSGSGSVNIQRKNEPVPLENMSDLSNSKTFAATDYSIGYLNHGSKPKGSGYEYVIKPRITIDEMVSFARLMSNNHTKPYDVYQNDAHAHIAADKKNNIYAHVLFSKNDSLPTPYIQSNSKPCLLIYKKTGPSLIKLSLSNPDLGYSYKYFSPSVSVPIQIVLRGQWQQVLSHPDVTRISVSNRNTIFEFNTKDGLPIEIDLKKMD